MAKINNNLSQFELIGKHLFKDLRNSFDSVNMSKKSMAYMEN
jgi:hypothetical protein